jgi:uncharacterized protein with von Willebrand factor type A (vWA) domain
MSKKKKIEKLASKHTVEKEKDRRKRWANSKRRKYLDIEKAIRSGRPKGWDDTDIGFKNSYANPNFEKDRRETLDAILKLKPRKKKKKKK